MATNGLVRSATRLLNKLVVAVGYFVLFAIPILLLIGLWKVAPAVDACLFSAVAGLSVVSSRRWTSGAPEDVAERQAFAGALGVGLVTSQALFYALAHFLNRPAHGIGIGLTYVISIAVARWAYIGVRGAGNTTSSRALIAGCSIGFMALAAFAWVFPDVFTGLISVFQGSGDPTKDGRD